MHRSAPTTPTLLLLLLGLAGMSAGSPGCGSTVLQGTGSSTTGAGGVGGSGAGTGPASASSGHAASASSSGAGGGHGGAGSAQGGGGTAGGTTCSGVEKLCGGKCVEVDDPAYGCTSTGCAPCATQYPNASQACTAGACVLGACDTGFKNCDGDPANGCETNLQDDPANCGACGVTCVTPHATPACDMGTCAVATCDSGWTDCNDDPTDGCEANLLSDPMNCGSCGTACPCFLLPCAMGTCADIDCQGEGLAHCPGDPLDQCPTVLGTNKNCNFCGDTCDLANATSNCDPNDMPCPAPRFVCDLVGCNAGFADCNLVAANGCETSTSTDPNNCGSCGNVCPSGPHSTAVCDAGACGITCDPGHFDCNDDPNDGCEVDGNSDTMNCGGCGQTCATTCSGGVCAP